MTAHPKRMWGGGPLRMFSDKRQSDTTIRYQSNEVDGFVGQYVCELCQRPCNGVYFVKSESSWLCGPCRELVRTPKALQPEHLKVKPRPLDNRAPK